MPYRALGCRAVPPRGFVVRGAQLQKVLETEVVGLLFRQGGSAVIIENVKVNQCSVEWQPRRLGEERISAGITQLATSENDHGIVWVSSTPLPSDTSSS